jgi:hypothetical protein
MTEQQLICDINEKINAEVEHRVKEWLIFNAGTDWTEKFQTLARQNIELQHQNAKLLIELNTVKQSLETLVKWVGQLPRDA